MAITDYFRKVGTYAVATVKWVAAQYQIDDGLNRMCDASPAPLTEDELEKKEQVWEQLIHPPQPNPKVWNSLDCQRYQAKFQLPVEIRKVRFEWGKDTEATESAPLQSTTPPVQFKGKKEAMPKIAITPPTAAPMQEPQQSQQIGSALQAVTASAPAEQQSSFVASATSAVQPPVTSTNDVLAVAPDQKMVLAESTDSFDQSDIPHLSLFSISMCTRTHEKINADWTYFVKTPFAFARPPKHCEACGYVSAEQDFWERVFYDRARLEQSMHEVHDFMEEVFTAHVDQQTGRVDESALRNDLLQPKVHAAAAALTERMCGLLKWASLPTASGELGAHDPRKLQQADILRCGLAGVKMDTLLARFTFTATCATASSGTTNHVYQDTVAVLSTAKAFFAAWPAPPAPPPPEPFDEQAYRKHGMFAHHVYPQLRPIWELPGYIQDVEWFTSGRNSIACDSTSVPTSFDHGFPQPSPEPVLTQDHTSNFSSAVLQQNNASGSTPTPLPFSDGQTSGSLFGGPPNQAAGITPGSAVQGGRIGNAAATPALFNIQPTQPSTNPLVAHGNNFSAAQADVKAWMSDVLNSQTTKLFSDLKKNTTNMENWKGALNDPQFVKILTDVTEKLDWILEWATSPVTGKADEGKMAKAEWQWPYLISGKRFDDTASKFSIAKGKVRHEAVDAVARAFLRVQTSFPRPKK